jgi:single-strand selective monofunctional uracil DNA glycosylase
LTSSRNTADIRKSPADDLVLAAKRLARQTSALRFSLPVAYVYNPLAYAWDPHETYLRKFGDSRKHVLFLGMNPGPFGMAQTGVPFGEIPAARNWLRIDQVVGKPHPEHPRRPITGFACERSEVSGRRLWGLFAERFGQAQDFFTRHFVTNYCPLVFLEDSGRNRTPDKLPAAEQAALFQVCDEHLRQVIEVLQPEWLIGVGDFAAKRAEKIFAAGEVKIGRILHPSPASPAANKGWAAKATGQLQDLGVWD